MPPFRTDRTCLGFVSSQSHCYSTTTGVSTTTTQPLPNSLSLSSLVKSLNMPSRKASCCLLLLFLAVSTFAIPIKRRRIPPVSVAEELAPKPIEQVSRAFETLLSPAATEEWRLHQTPPANVVPPRNQEGSTRQQLDLALPPTNHRRVRDPIGKSGSV